MRRRHPPGDAIRRPLGHNACAIDLFGIVAKSA
jgi:hypothetical protein